ncbi:hypothetical protein BV20DRAFT_713600 [Pilatotrama ljubarskyi]|nr:hypothetical protein BV20DRAFT_713600 [Pilatotrama ljubarskyi]
MRYLVHSYRNSQTVSGPEPGEQFRPFPLPVPGQSLGHCPSCLRFFITSRGRARDGCLSLLALRIPATNHCTEVSWWRMNGTRHETEACVDVRSAQHDGHYPINIHSCNSLGKVQRLFSFRRRGQQRRKVDDYAYLRNGRHAPVRFVPLCLLEENIVHCPPCSPS